MYFDKKPLLFPNKKIERKNAQNSKMLWTILKKHLFFTNLKSTCDDVISFAKLAKTSWRHFVWQAFYVYLLINFFYRGFLSQTLMIHMTAGEGRGPSFISLYYVYLLTNIETFICNFVWPEYHIFLMETLVFTRLNEIYHFIEWPFHWLTDDAMFVCLLDELFLGFFVTAILQGKLVDVNLAITLVLQANQLTNCAN